MPVATAEADTDVSLSGLTIRELICELSAVEDERRRRRGADDRELRARELAVVAELRRRSSLQV